jgi:hypothetical protein
MGFLIQWMIYLATDSRSYHELTAEYMRSRKQGLGESMTAT